MDALGKAPDGTAVLAAFSAQVRAACGVGLDEVVARTAASLGGRGSPRDDLAVYRYLSYHLGLTDLDGGPLPTAARGKGIRPLVCLCAAAAVGGDAANAVGVAAAVELTHEFSLIHDDIQDGDRLRRGRPTLWTQVGVAQAINAGDALFAIARALLTAPDRAYDDATAVALAAAYDEACLRLAEGQQQDIGFETGAPVTDAAYLRMVTDKTGALLGAAAAMGALAGGAEAAVAAGLGRFGETVGVAFQIHDDVLGLWGRPERTGKPAGNDLRRRKRSLPILRGLAHPDIGDELAARLADERPLDDDETSTWLDRLEAAGCREAAAAEALAAAAEALDLLQAMNLRPEPAELLRGLTRAAVERDR